MSDLMVQATQIWLNNTYGDINGFGSVPEDGKTGWPTVYGLLRALQIEMGITTPTNAFGPTTSSLYSQNPLQRQDGVHSNKFAILQGALWCKGYDPGHYASSTPGGLIADVFDAKVERAVIAFKKDAGLENPNGTVTLNVIKALLTMDAFKLLSAYGGRTFVRNWQQAMNKNYEAYIGLMPCDGVYGRNTNKAVIYAIQAEEGLAVGVANGVFGPSTQHCLPRIPYDRVARSYDTGAVYSERKIAAFTEIMQFGLAVNGFGNGYITGVFDATTEDNIRRFQTHHAIPVTGVCDLTTWLSLYLSSGDTTRAAQACDTSTILTTAQAGTIYNEGYRVVGRYLTGNVLTSSGTLRSKAMTPAELEIIRQAGLSYFPIFQDGGTSEASFNVEKASKDAPKALTAAKTLGAPAGSIIYFAVDFDAMDVHITNNILPYFQVIASIINLDGTYKVGIYGARNVCSRVARAGYSVSSFVSDMSTGFSGNLGFIMPTDWAYDQFAGDLWIGSGEGRVQIDKVSVSSRAKPIGGGLPIGSASEFEEKLTVKIMEYVDFSRRETGHDVPLHYQYYAKTIPYKSAQMAENEQVVLKELLVECFGEDLSSISREALEEEYQKKYQFLGNECLRYGVDCSGFTYYCLNEATNGAMYSFFKEKFPNEAIHYETGIHSSNQASNVYFETIEQIKDMRPGDVVFLEGSYAHIILIYHIERNANGKVVRVHIAHSSPECGPHVAYINVADDTKGIFPDEDIAWVDREYSNSTRLGKILRWVVRPSFISNN